MMITLADEKCVFQGIIFFMVAEFLWELYLGFRQHRVYKKYDQIPDELIGIIARDTFDKARVYGLDKNKYGMIKECFNLVQNVGILFLNGLVFFWDVGGKMLLYFEIEPAENEILQSAGFMLAMNLFTTLTGLPFIIYYTFVLEEKHGFNKQTVSFFIKDKIKSYIVGQVISIPIICGLIKIVKIGGDLFFIYLWLFAMLATFFFLTIYPDYIAPLFDKYTPLPEGDLRTQIEKLAKSVDFPLYKLYVVEGSKRSVHSNAYFYGFFKNKRIVLFDTLLKDYTPVKSEKTEPSSPPSTTGETPDENDKSMKGCDTNEVLAVLGHELGHWKLNHIMKNLVIMQLNLLLVFLAFSAMFTHQPLYRAFGFSTSPVLIGLLIVLQYVFTPYFALLNFVMADLSRRFEFQADRYAKSLGRSNYLRLALIKLNCDNLGFPIYDPWYSKWNHSHPPLLERLRALEKED